MTANAARASPASPYSALGAAPETRQEEVKRVGAEVEAEAALLLAETERLAVLKKAMWESFMAAPLSPVRAPVIDIVMAYTDALRLELKLRASAKGGKAADAVRTMARAGFKAP